MAQHIKDSIKNGVFTEGVDTQTITPQGIAFADIVEKDPMFKAMSNDFKKLLEPKEYRRESKAGRLEGRVLAKEQMSGTWIPDKATETYEKRETGAIIVLLDKSGSMYGDMTQAGMTALAVMDGARKAGLDTSLYTYGAGRYATKQMDKKSKRLHLDPEASGGTPSAEALASVIDVESKKGQLLDKKDYKRRTILHITDGQPSSAGIPIVKSFNNILNKQGVFTPAIGIGVDQSMMRTMYQQVETVMQGSDIPKAVRNTIKNVAKNRKPPKIKTYVPQGRYQGFQTQSFQIEGSRTPSQGKLNRATKV